MFKRYDGILVMRCLRMVELGAATIGEIADLANVPKRTIEAWARIAGLFDFEARRARQVTAIWEDSTMPMFTAHGRSSKPQVNQLDMREPMPGEIIKLKTKCACGAPGRVGVFAAGYYRTDFQMPAYVCGPCRQKAKEKRK